MIKIYHKTIKDPQLKILPDFKVGSWIYVENPSEQELDELAQRFNLELGHLKDAVDPHEVPRLEIEKGAVYIFRRAPHEEEGRVMTVPVLTVVGKDFVLTVSRQPLSFLQKFIKGEVKFNTTQKTKLVLQFFSEITASYNYYLTAIRRQVQSIGLRLERIQRITSGTVVQLVKFEEILNDFLAGLVPASAILEKLVSGKVLPLHAEDHDLVEDLSLSTGQLIIQSRASLRTIVNYREAYSTIMTNDLNRIIKFLTALTIILNVQMIITGLYGMNVSLPFSSSPLAFWGIVVFMLIISLVLLLVFFKNKWL